MKRTSAIFAAALAMSSMESYAVDLQPSTAVNYVKICDAYGAGFFYIPGSDTCLRIGGYARYELRTRTVANSGTQNASGTFVRSVVDIESIANTEYGIARTFMSMRNNMATPSTPGGNPLKSYLDQGFLQLGGLSAGLKDSFFDFAGGYEHDWEIIGLSNGDSDHKANMLAYTFKFSKQLSATASLEDATVANLQNLGSSAVPAGVTAPTIGGMILPDVVGNLTYVDSWGRAMISGVYHKVHTAADGTVFVNQPDKSGFAMQASLRVYTPTIGKGDSLVLSGSLSDGATKYVLTSLSGFDVNAKSNGLTNINPTIADAYQSRNALQLVRACAGFAAYQHYWLPNVQTDFFGSYAIVNNPAGFANSRIWNAGTVLFVDPWPQLRMGPEIQYQNDRIAAIGTTPVIKGDDWRFTFRVNRSF